MLSRNGSMNDDTIPEHAEDENFDDEPNFEFESDGPPGCVDSSSGEELHTFESERSLTPSIYRLEERRLGVASGQERQSHLHEED